ncbi:MAG: hypothetical protein JW747_08480 [Candidatus Aminicenantes bacterium]|nr:hypothetical protein [Candidatus Aminicenantes bacterium]
MAHIKGYSLCKILAVVLSVLIAGQAHFAFAGRAQDETLEAKFEAAKALYFAEDYEGAKAGLEELAAALGRLEGSSVLKGKTYLLLGAAYEKLDAKEPAVNSYCRAKEILGAGKTIEGLDLEELKYYQEPCRVVTGRTAARKGGGFLGKALGIVLFVGAVAGLVWWLFFSKNAPLKATGEYTSVTVQVDVTYKGKNSFGTRTLAFDGVEQLNEGFSYAQPASPCNPPDEFPTCDDATQSEFHSFLVETDGKSLEMIQMYLGWDYFDRTLPCCKVLCADWTLTVVEYEYESGKKDPGSPNIVGIENLELDFNNDCVPDPVVFPNEYVHDCTTQATLTFQAPSAGAKVKKTFTAHQTFKHSN